LTSYIVTDQKAFTGGSCPAGKEEVAREVTAPSTSGKISRSVMKLWTARCPHCLCVVYSHTDGNMPSRSIFRTMEISWM
jgi:hypothetical protein